MQLLFMYFNMFYRNKQFHNYIYSFSSYAVLTFPMTVFLYISIDCCPLEMPTLRVIQAHFHDFCAWIISASSLGLSSAAYILRGSNGTLVGEGTMTENKMVIINEPVHEKTNNLGFRPGPTQTRLYSHSIKLEA